MIGKLLGDYDDFLTEVMSWDTDAMTRDYWERFDQMMRQSAGHNMDLETPARQRKPA